MHCVHVKHNICLTDFSLVQLQRCDISRLGHLLNVLYIRYVQCTQEMTGGTLLLNYIVHVQILIHVDI